MILFGLRLFSYIQFLKWGREDIARDDGTTLMQFLKHAAESRSNED